MPGGCKGRAHDADHLGYGGRRVLASRKWSGKTLADHRADRKEHRLVWDEEAVPAACPDRLTDLLTRRCGTGETAWDVGDKSLPRFAGQRDAPERRRRGRRAS